ncbi:Uncharacterised protein [Vibrio cholerae]|nr:Uncharacterised protein [Vibrio cholerae]
MVNTCIKPVAACSAPAPAAVDGPAPMRESHADTKGSLTALQVLVIGSLSVFHEP